MKKFLLFLGVALATTLSVNEASAQIKLGENGGQVSVALESNSSYYAEDKTLESIGLIEPIKRSFGDYGSNNFLKVDYNLDQFSAGAQLDGYFPALYGYDLYEYMKKKDRYNGNSTFLSFYTQYETQNWGVRVGDIYDQFGNGLIFRSYEDRALAFNNSLLGARAHYSLGTYATIKALAGMPRLYNDRTDNWIYGADLSLSLSDMFGWNSTILSLEGSYVGRHDSDISEFNMDKWNDDWTEIIGVENKLDGLQNMNMVSGRVNFEHSGFTFRGEYVAKLTDDLHNPAADVAKGNVIFLDFGYNYKRFSATASFRRMENMTTPIDPRLEPIGGGNNMNYIPLLTRQHTYSLANLNPYLGTNANTGGEIGGQIDLYYSLRNPKVRGKYWNFHVNFSMFNTIDHTLLGSQSETPEFMEGRNAWIDFNFDVERQWNKKFKTTFLYSFQRWDEELNHIDASHPMYCTSHIFVGDVTYKINKKHSVRVEAQYLSSEDFEGDWVAGTIEYNFAPKFSIYASDMWNCEPMGDSQMAGGFGGNYFEDLETGEGKNYLLHYYQLGASYTHNSLRVQLSYGRNRAGYVCSGGVCRFQPAFTGGNLSMTLSF